MKIKKTLLAGALVLAGALAFTGCGKSNDGGKDAGEKKEAGKASVYYLNFKPEVEEVWKEIAAKYEEETGVPVKVVTAASGTYESTLKAEITKDDAPTLFQINGPIGYQNWKDYTKDLKDTEIYSHLVDKDLAVKDGEGVYGIPYVVEGYGIIYNDALVQKYIGLDGAKIKSVDEINNFAKLKEVAEDMQAKKDKLGIQGAFACTSLKPGEDWRWQTHLANLPIFYEYRDNKTKDMAEVEFKYDKEYKNIFDLYLQNSTVAPEVLTGKAVTDSMAEFALEQAVFVQNGNWAWSQISEVSGNKVKEENIKFLPIYTGVKGEEKQSICVGTENFFSINSKASEENQKATEDFLKWLFTSDEGKDFVTNKLGFIAPFDTFKEEDQPKDPLAKEVARYMSNKDLYNVDWNFTSFPSQAFKDFFGQALGQYASGSMKWDEVKEAFVTSWKDEKAATSQEK
ncbi:ABC transporter substrate-binding protein [Anaerococcus lactolyticus]|uniref:ABC transporter substrate-binding protein n=1 Tax=Anaerococcus lactolyticus S7-1-13 TaxID=1284686 RepID=A0A095YFR7_9FIRM|nr:ABC transporter substrate-binding protein [Anaerococcus lactolyticus]KGF05367.1 ABC transporter substrate-binding protein [Anaerococcus lactolyticus S7-1-13]